MPKKFLRSFKFARAGASHVLLTQRNIWIHLFIGMLILLAAVCLRVKLVELAVIVLTVSFVIVIEMINTAIEETVNLVKPENHPLAALAKNVAAGAVLVAAFGSVIIGLLILAPRVFKI
ncbi:MAG: diacylglycerol kinase family protein [Candidatus Margulisiibacteriota bacterium]